MCFPRILPSCHQSSAPLVKALGRRNVFSTVLTSLAIPPSSPQGNIAGIFSGAWLWQGGGESAGAETLSSQGSWGPGIPRIPWASHASLWIFSPELGTGAWLWQGGGESAGAETLSSQGSWGPGIPRIPWASHASLWIFSPELGTKFHQVTGSSCRGSGTSIFSRSSLDAMGLMKTSVLPSDRRNVLDTVVWNLWGDGSVLLWENQSREEDHSVRKAAFLIFMINVHSLYMIQKIQGNSQAPI